MRKVIDTTQAKRIGRCIYCRTTEGRLTDEHITPYGLSGRLVLREASCNRCAGVTSALERGILKNTLFAARAALGTRTRHPRDRANPHPMLVERAGRAETIYAVWNDHWKVIQLPIFPLPASIDGRPYASGIEFASMDVFELGERGEEIAKRHCADKMIPPKFRADDFARFIAKMAYACAVERYDLDAFEAVYVLPAILGESDDVGRWVGCPDRREFPVRQCNISVGFKIIPHDDLAVRIKMFPQFDGVEYVTVVGRVKAVYRNYFHARGEQG